jgi:hypothetical protein
MITEIESFESPDLSPLGICLKGWMTSKFCIRKVDTRDELLTHILDAAACIEKCEDQLR